MDKTSKIQMNSSFFYPKNFTTEAIFKDVIVEQKKKKKFKKSKLNVG